MDNEDFELLNQYNWYVLSNHSGKFYAVRMSSRTEGKRHQFKMDRHILVLDYGDRREADHINHNILDNRQDNLRICTHQQNMMNQKSRLNASSRFKGVYWDKQHNKWRVAIRIDGHKKYLGLFDIEELAALTYDMVAIREHGEFACLNFN